MEIFQKGINIIEYFEAAFLKSKYRFSYKLHCILWEQNEECDIWIGISATDHSLLWQDLYSWIRGDQNFGAGISEACWRIQCAIRPTSRIL